MTTPRAAGDTQRNMYDIVQESIRGFLLVPGHQRDADAWDIQKQKKYVQRLQESRDNLPPPGLLATFEIVEVVDGERHAVSPIQLNDGRQRVNVFRTLLESPKEYGLSETEARSLLDMPMTVQHRHYKSLDEAMRDFQLINNGTRLTPYDLCQGYLKYMPEYKDVWAGILHDIVRAVNEGFARVRNSKVIKPNRNKDHQLVRSTYALFHRFSTGERRLTSYKDVSRSEIPAETLTASSVIEGTLKAHFLAVGKDQIRDDVKTFRSLVERETTLMDELNRAISPAIGITPALYRALLDIAIWVRHVGISRERYEAFARAMLRNSGGQGLLHYPEGAVDRRGKPKMTETVRLNSLERLPVYAEIVGIPDFHIPPKREIPTAPFLKPGYDNSHIEPFTPHGNGPTFPEPASTNRARGAQTVDLIDDELPF